MSEKEIYGVSVKAFGAAGDGERDDAAAFQAALDSGSGLVAIPEGKYKIGRPLFIGSDTKLSAHKNAHIRLADGACVKRGDYLLSNKDPGQGNYNISIEGGIWDANNRGNPRLGELFDQDCVSGTMLNFRNVGNLTLSGMVLRDPEAYYIRICEVYGFRIEHIRFEAENLSKNQDGIHIAGFCRDGVIRHIEAVGDATNDDFLAFNADDCVTRRENLGTICGPIDNIVVHDVRAENCYTLIRMLSVNSPITNISISGIKAGCRYFFLNMDGARYCRTPLIPTDSERFYSGAGEIRNVEISDVDVSFHADVKARFCVETNVDNVRVRNFRSSDPVKAPCAVAVNCKKTRFILEGVEKDVAEKLAAESSCKSVKTVSEADCGGREAYRVEAVKDPGERLVIPAGGFDELKIN